MDENIVRLLRLLPDGTRVRAVMAITYVTTEVEVEVGTLGTVVGHVEDIPCLHLIQWDGVDEPQRSTVDGVEPLGN